MTETPPQSGSGRKEQTKSKAAPSIADSILHSACSRSFVENRRWQVKGAALALSWGFKGAILYGREWPLWSHRRQAANVAPPSGGRSHSIASLRLPETSTSFFGSVRLSTPSL